MPKPEGCIIGESFRRYPHVVGKMKKIDLFRHVVWRLAAGIAVYQ
jgi:predicted RNA-binding protein